MDGNANDDEWMNGQLKRAIYEERERGRETYGERERERERG